MVEYLSTFEGTAGNHVLNFPLKVAKHHTHWQKMPLTEYTRVFFVSQFRGKPNICCCAGGLHCARLCDVWSDPLGVRLHDLCCICL